MWAHRMRAPSRLELFDTAPPSAADLGAGRVLLRTLAGGICGSDIPKFRGIRGAVVDPSGAMRPGPAGYPLHEVVGEVVASRHPDVLVGTPVVGWADHSDGLAEFVVSAGAQVNTFDDAFDPESAVLIQSLACVLAALKSLPILGLSVAVMGLGPIGLLFAHVCRSLGARTVVGIDPVDRSDEAAAFGLDETICTPSGNWAPAVQAAGSGPELLIEAVGHQVSTLRHALVGVAPGGTVLYFGIPDDDVYPLEMEVLVRKNVTLIGGVVRDRRQVLAEGNEYLIAYPELVKNLISQRFSKHDAQAAFDVAATPAVGRLKVVLALG